MRKCARPSRLPSREAGIILLSAGTGILAVCFFPPQATVAILSVLLALSGVCMILKNGGGQC